MKHPFPKDYNQAILWARGILESPAQWVILDTETTGLKDTDVVIQLAVIDLNGNALIDTFLKPARNITFTPEAIAVHGITPEMVVSAPFYKDIYPELSAMMKGKGIIAYNVEFDKRLLKQTAQQDSAPVIKANWECAMVQYSQYSGQWSEYHKNYKFQRLPSGDHSALGDCRATLKIIQTMASSSLID